MVDYSGHGTVTSSGRETRYLWWSSYQLYNSNGRRSVRSSGATVVQWLERKTLDKKRTRVRVVCRSDEHCSFRSLYIVPVQSAM